MPQPMTAHPAESLPHPGVKSLGFRRQFGLASLILLVLWAASAILVGLNWAPWAVTRTYDRLIGSPFFSEDGSRALVWNDTHFEELNARSGAERNRFAAPAESGSQWRPSPDWSRVAIRYRDEKEKPEHFTLVNLASGAEELSIECSRIREMHFSSDGERLFVQHAWSVDVFRRDRAEPLRSLRALYPSDASDEENGTAAPPPPSKTDVATAETALQSAETLATHNATVEALDGQAHETELKLRLAPRGAAVVSELIRKDGKRFACVWDVESGRREARLDGYADTCDLDDLVFSADGRAAGLLDYVQHRATVWSLETGQLLARWPLPAELQDGGSLLLSHDGHLAALNGPGEAWLWDCAHNRALAHAQGARVEAFSPDGSRVACANAPRPNRLLILDSASGLPLCETAVGESPCGVFAQHSPDGSVLAVSSHTPFSVTHLLYSRRHGEGPYGIFEMPVTWAFVALTLVQLARIVRALRRRKTAVAV